MYACSGSKRLEVIRSACVIYSIAIPYNCISSSRGIQIERGLVIAAKWTIEAGDDRCLIDAYTDRSKVRAASATTRSKDGSNNNVCSTLGHCGRTADRSII